MELKAEDIRINIITENPDESISILKKQAVKIVHLPTGIEAQCGYYKANHKNRKICEEMIEYALVDLKS